MNATEFDHRFDKSESVMDTLDLASVRKPNLEQRKVNVDFPIWMIEGLDRTARRLRVPRQSVIKMWIAERLEHEAVD